MVIDVMPNNPALDFVGNAFSYVRPDPNRLSSSKVHSLNDCASYSAKTTTFRSISGASVGANPTSAPLASTQSTLESSELVSSLSLQPVPRGSTFCLSGPVEGGFISGPIDDKCQISLSDGNGFIKAKKESLSQMTTSFKEAIISNKMLKVSDNSDKELSSDTEQSNENLLTEQSNEKYQDNDDDDQTSSMKTQNLQWAQGKAGEDRTHLVVSEENGWIFVGVYDGFSGADAPDHLVANLFNAVFEELKGMLLNSDHHKAKSGEAKWKCDWESGICELISTDSSMDDDQSFEHSDVLKALSQALSKTEESYLQLADSKPQLHIIGSCVLVMLMKGEDVYLMNLGDSRAILAQQQSKSKTNRQTKPPLIHRQLTMDHNAEVEEVLFFFFF